MPVQANTSVRNPGRRATARDIVTFCDLMSPAVTGEDAMVYIASWQEYQEAAENLYVKSPSKVGLSVVVFCSAASCYPDAIFCEMEIVRGETCPQDHR